MIAVTGAGGWVGREVCNWLQAHGAGVRPLSRQREVHGAAFLDLQAPAAHPSWKDALHDCSTVLHCAAHVHRPVETDTELALFRAINVDGTKKLLDAAESAGVRRIVLVSTAALYDWTATQPATEESTLRPTTMYAGTKLEAEQVVRSSGLDWCIARLGTVFGIGDRANFFRLAQSLRRRRFVLPGDGSAQKSVIAVAKAGAILGRLSLEGRARNVVLNVAAPVAPSLIEISQAFAHICGFPVPPHVSLPVMKAIAGVGDVVASIRPNFPLTSSILGKLTTSTVMDTTRLCALFPEESWPTFEESLRPAASYYAIG